MPVRLLNADHHVQSSVLIVLRGGRGKTNRGVHVVSEGADKGVIPLNVPSFAVRNDVVFD